MLKPLRTAALTTACLAVLALGACSEGNAGDSAGDAPPVTSSSEAPDPESADSPPITGKWEYIPEGHPGSVAGFTVAEDGTVAEFWKEGTIGVGSATIKPYHGGWALDWEYASAQNPVDGSYLLTPIEGEDAWKGQIVESGDYVTFTRAV